jgi:hypothetical protein
LSWQQSRSVKNLAPTVFRNRYPSSSNKSNVKQLIAVYNSPKELRRAKSGHNNGAEAAIDVFDAMLSSIAYCMARSFVACLHNMCVRAPECHVDRQKGAGRVASDHKKILYRYLM